MNDTIQYWRNKWNQAADHSKATDTSKLFRVTEEKSHLNSGHYYRKDGTWLFTIEKSEDIYVLKSNEEKMAEVLHDRNLTNYSTIEAFQNPQTPDFDYKQKDFIKLSIFNTELNQRAFWVFNESRGSNHIIKKDEIKNNADNFGDEIIGLTVAEIYANAIQNAIKKDGSWFNVYTGSRLSRGEGNTGVAMMNGTGGNDYTKYLVNDYLSDGPIVFEKHLNATNARAAVIGSITNHKKIGDVRAWLGEGSAEKYFDDSNNVYVSPKNKYHPEGVKADVQYTIRYENEVTKTTFNATFFKLPL